MKIYCFDFLKKIINHKISYLRASPTHSVIIQEAQEKNEK